jgi:hypothetical protein
MKGDGPTVSAVPSSPSYRQTWPGGIHDHELTPKSESPREQAASPTIAKYAKSATGKAITRSATATRNHPRPWLPLVVTGAE